MSHQVNFYLTPRDTVALEAEMRRLATYVILCSRSATAQPRVLPALDHEEAGQPWLYFHMVLPEDLPLVSTRHVPAQGYWTIDVIKSPTIEINRCFFDGHVLRRGRLYYVDKFHGPGDGLISKSDIFCRWAKSVFSVTKKFLLRRGTDYIGPDASSWLESSGGKLVA